MSTALSTRSASDPDLIATADLFRLLGAPVRLAILGQLVAGPRCVHDLVDALGHSQALVSQHLRTLRYGRIVSAQRRGREMVYRIDDSHIEHIITDALTHVEEENR